MLPVAKDSGVLPLPRLGGFGVYAPVSFLTRLLYCCAALRVSEQKQQKRPVGAQGCKLATFRAGSALGSVQRRHRRASCEGNRAKSGEERTKTLGKTRALSSLPTANRSCRKASERTLDGELNPIDAEGSRAIPRDPCRGGRLFQIEIPTTPRALSRAQTDRRHKPRDVGRGQERCVPNKKTRLSALVNVAFEASTTRTPLRRDANMQRSSEPSLFYPQGVWATSAPPAPRGRQVLRCWQGGQNRKRFVGAPHLTRNGLRLPLFLS